VKIAVLVRI